MRGENVEIEETVAREANEVKETIEIATEIDAIETAVVKEIVTHTDIAIEEVVPVRTTNMTTNTAKR
jgi:hypothetical protein